MQHTRQSWQDFLGWLSIESRGWNLGVCEYERSPGAAMPGTLLVARDTENIASIQNAAPLGVRELEITGFRTMVLLADGEWHTFRWRLFIKAHRTRSGGPS